MVSTTTLAQDRARVAGPASPSSCQTPRWFHINCKSSYHSSPPDKNLFANGSKSKLLHLDFLDRLRRCRCSAVRRRSRQCSSLRCDHCVVEHGLIHTCIQQHQLFLDSARDCLCHKGFHRETGCNDQRDKFRCDEHFNTGQSWK